MKIWFVSLQFWVYSFFLSFSAHGSFWAPSLTFHFIISFSSLSFTIGQDPIINNLVDLELGNKNYYEAYLQEISTNFNDYFPFYAEAGQIFSSSVLSNVKAEGRAS